MSLIIYWSSFQVGRNYFSEVLRRLAHICAAKKNKLMFSKLNPIFKFEWTLLFPNELRWGATGTHGVILKGTQATIYFETPGLGTTDLHCGHCSPYLFTQWHILPFRLNSTTVHWIWKGEMAVRLQYWLSVYISGVKINTAITLPALLTPILS